MPKNEFMFPLIDDVPENRLPLPSEVNYYSLLKDRKIYLDFDICDEVSTIHQMILRWNMEDKDKPVEERQPIWIYIQSPGGELYYMWMIVDAILLSATPVYTVNLGMAASAASLIFMAGHKRFMTPNAKVLIHEGQASFAGEANKVMDATDSYKKDLKAMKDFILAHTSIPKTQLMKKRTSDWELDSAYCLENKGCDKIISSWDEVL